MSAVGKRIFHPFLVRTLKNPELCPECRREKRAKVQAYIEKIREFGRDSYLDGREERELQELRSRLGLSEEDLREANRILENLRRLTKQADTARYEARLKEAGEDSYLDPEEERELEELRKSLSLTEEDISHTVGELVRLKRLTAIKNGKLPVLEPGIILRKKEVCHYEVPAELVEERTRTRYVGGSRGVSFRIAKGVYYRVGGFRGERVVDTFKEVTDEGTLYVTNKRVLFVGSKKNVSYPINKIVAISRYADAIQFQKENEARPKYFLIRDPYAIDEIGLIVNKIITGI